MEYSLGAYDAVKLPRRKIDVRVRKRDRAPCIRRSAQRGPRCEISRTEHGVDPRRPCDSKLHRSGQMTWLDQQNTRRGGYDVDPLGAQGGNGLGKIRGLDFGQKQRPNLITDKDKGSQTRLIRGQTQAGDLVI